MFLLDWQRLNKDLYRQTTHRSILYKMLLLFPDCPGQTMLWSTVISPWQHPVTQPKCTIVQLPRDCSRSPAVFGPGLLQFSPDICQCSEIYFKHQLTLSGFPEGIFTDKIGWLVHHPWMSGGNQSQGHWLTQESVPRSVRNNNRLWEGIQSERGLMILIQPATSDKAPMLSTKSSSPLRNSLLISRR